MYGSEGGIPYHTPRRPLTVHMRATGSSKPACGSNPWRFQTTTNPEHVTCWDCKRKMQAAHRQSRRAQEASAE